MGSKHRERATTLAQDNLELLERLRGPAAWVDLGDDVDDDLQPRFADDRSENAPRLADRRRHGARRRPPRRRALLRVDICAHRQRPAPAAAS